MNKSLPTRAMRERPDLDQLKRQAKELLEAFLAGSPDAIAEVNTHYRDADHKKFALHDAQLVLARSYGFESWPKLKAYVDGVAVKHLAEAVRARNISRVRSMLKVRPELASMGIDDYEVLHYAVLDRAPEMVRILMEHGANAREGVYPHREATSPLTIASERGYDEIVAIIKEEEGRRRQRKSGLHTASSPDDLFKSMASGGTDRALEMLDSNPALVQTSNHEGWSPLHLAAAALNLQIIAWLIEHGADVNQRGPHGRTPLDVCAERVPRASEFAAISTTLLSAGAELTARAAVALGDTEWLQARHANGDLVKPITDWGGLLRVAVTHDQPDILALLLDFGLDPDERTRLDFSDEPVYSWGMPLWECAGSGKYEMAEMLLKRGADPNAPVYASGDPMFQAYGQRDWKMVELLKIYGGVPMATSAGLYRQTELARKMLAGEADYRLDGVGGETLAEQLLWGAACGGDAEIVRMALERVDWPRDDRRWFEILEQPLRIWNYGSGHWASRDWDRGTYLTCFQLLVERCDPNIRGRVQDGGQFGLTILHGVAGSRDHVTPEERVAFAAVLLDAGARLDTRDNLLNSTPLGWACRWGRVELVKLFLERGADPIEPDAEPWATPSAWAEKTGHSTVLALIRDHNP